MFLEILQNSQENNSGKVFFCEIYKISNNRFFTEHLWSIASENQVFAYPRLLFCLSLLSWIISL